MSDAIPRPIRVWRLDALPSPTPTPTQLDTWREWCEDNGWTDSHGQSVLNYPTPNRKLWFTKAAATKKAVWLRRWGYEVTVIMSLPVVWEDHKLEVSWFCRGIRELWDEQPDDCGDPGSFFNHGGCGWIVLGVKP